MWFQIGILIVSALVSNWTRKKPEQPKPQEATAPVVEDGKRQRRIYGTVWVDDSIVLGWKEIGQDPIRTKGGKK